MSTGARTHYRRYTTLLLAPLAAATTTMNMYQQQHQQQQPHIQQQRHPTLEPLTSASVVFCSRGLESLAHVVDLVSSYLDGAVPSRWMIDRACASGFSLRMLKRLAMHEEIIEMPGSSPSMDPFYRAYLAARGLIAAVKRGDNVDIVRFVCCEYCPSVVPVLVMGEAAECGRLCVLQWFVERYPNVRVSRFVVSKAVAGDCIEVLQWLTDRLEGSLYYIADLVYAAAMRGHLESIRWLHELRDPAGGPSPATRNGYRDPKALGAAIAGGHFEVAEFLVDYGYEPDRMQRERIAKAVTRGDLALVKWVHSIGFMGGAPGWIEEAALAGHLHIVQWLYNNAPGISRDGYAMDSAARNGHLNVVRWLHVNRRDECSADAMDGAAAGGHLAVVQWLDRHRSEGCTTQAMNRAAASGHLDVVKWLHENRFEGCTPLAMNSAAANGHLEVVKWLDANRSERCTNVAMDRAAENGHLHVVQWLHERRAEGCTSRAMDSAANNGHLDVVQWLHENRSEGCTTQAMDWTRSIRVLQWLHTNRIDGCTHRATDNAVRHGNFEKLLFLHEHDGLAVVTERTLVLAFRRNEFEMYQWLRAKYPELVETAAAITAAEPITASGSAQTVFMQFER